ncbi:MAG: OmpA family protein [Spirochaeta sp.]|jgi:outer membrane protein OmpA-like peptidoglycan-associated protein|nr:OmpA family protein [Spirochaeta sp.]
MKNNTVPVFFALVIALLAVTGCASAPETPPAESEPAQSTETQQVPEPQSTEEVTPEETDSVGTLSESESAVTLRPGSGSFSPENADAQRFFIDGAANQPIQSWEFTVTDDTGQVVSRESGTGAPPEVVEWDGTTADGTAPEGRYSSALMIRYDDESERTVETNPFLLDMTDPVPSFRLSGTPFTPDGDGNRDELIITIDAEDASPIVAWLFEIQTTDGQTLAQYTDMSDVPRTARWNGRPGRGFVVQSGDEYRIVGGVRDEAGNEGRTETSFVIGAMTERHRGRARIMLPSIQFPANSARITDASPAARERFENVVDRLARILAMTEGTVLIEGHANSTRFSGSLPDPEEQRRELIPLSRDRATVVRQALIERGIDADRLETDGVGATDPIAPFGDARRRVENRRIEFYLID